MDEKQSGLIYQYYKYSQQNKIFCKECGCTLDAYAENNHYASYSVRPDKIKSVIIICAAVISAVLIICSAVISNLKTSQENYENNITDLKNRLYYAGNKIDFFDNNTRIVLKGSNIYHYYDCPYIKNARSELFIYDIKLLDSKNFVPCKKCGKQGLP